MKPTGKTVILFVGFFALWLAITSIGFAITAHMGGANAAMQRFWDEAVPLTGVILATFLFHRFIDKKTPLTSCRPHSGKEVGFYCAIALIWLGIPIGVLLALNSVRFISVNHVAEIGIWLLAALLNVFMQELLVRGYLFQVVLRRHNVIAAVTVTTGLFLALHGGEGGLLGMLNVIAASLLLTVPLIYGRSLFGSIVLHAIWNLVGAIVLGCVSLGGVYPQLSKVKFSGPLWLSGGNGLIEGSVVTLIVTATLVIGMVVFMRRKHVRTRRA